MELCVNRSRKEQSQSLPLCRREFLYKVFNYVKKLCAASPGPPNDSPHILIYTDTLPFSKPQAKAVEVVIKASCKAESKIPFHVLHHRIEGNYWIQVADYCSWSICRKWEFNDPTFYGQLRCKLAAPEIAPMSLGTGKTYY